MDYAQGNQENLGNGSFFLIPWRQGAEEHSIVGRMKAIAPLRFYRTPDEREGILQEEKADFFYCIKNGFNDGVFSKKVTTGIHAIFRESEFHGDVYAYVSPWLSEVMSYGKAPWVPHMVSLSNDNGDLRREDGGQMAEVRGPEDSGRGSGIGSQWADVVVPKDAIVFGRHGGDDSFDIPWVQEAVVETAKQRPDVWFLFLNTREFPGAAGLPNIRFLPPTSDPGQKRKFLNSCDAMLHGRMRGETFGLSCLEFAMLGKPVLTYAGSPERAHLEILGDSAVPYQNAKELRELLCHPSSVFRSRMEGERRPGGRDQMPDARCQMPEDGGQKTDADLWHQSSGVKTASDFKFKDYQPETVMQKFQEVFLR